MENLLIPLHRSINIIPDGVLIINSKCKIVIANSQAEKMFGYEPRALTGLHLNKLIPKRFHKLHNKHVRQYLEQPTVRNMSDNQSLFGLQKQGTEFDVSIALSPAMLQGKRVTVATVRDNTETRELQRALEWKNEQLKSINTELERFGYTISHDLKSPLANLQAILDLLVRELPQDKKQAFSEFLLHINKTLYSMSELVSGIAAYSMAQWPEAVGIERVDINKLIQEVRNLVLIPPHITLKVSKNLPDAWGNKTKILQLFLNLINNSIKHNDKKNGIIKISGRAVKKSVTFCVSDNGPGISPELRDQVFKLFDKGNSLRKDSQGIGLAIVHKIIEELGGSISIGESPMGGAEFKFKLPINSKEKFPAIEAAKPTCPVVQ